MTWDEIYERADGAACGDSTLKAKDEARHQVRQFVMEIGCPDPDDDEIPEETIEGYCNGMNIQFDSCGNIIGLNLPYGIEEIIYRRKEDYYLREDLKAMVYELYGADSKDATDEQLDRMMQIYRHRADCNVPYNSTIESAVKEVLTGQPY